MVKTIAAIFLFIHGFAHTVGFFVQWRIIKSNDMPYNTKLFFGKLDAGNAGIRITGLIWLSIAIVYVFAGYGILTSKGWWNTATPYNNCFFLHLLYCWLAGYKNGGSRQYYHFSIHNFESTI